MVTLYIPCHVFYWLNVLRDKSNGYFATKLLRAWVVLGERECLVPNLIWATDRLKKVGVHEMKVFTSCTNPNKRKDTSRYKKSRNNKKVVIYFQREHVPTSIICWYVYIHIVSWIEYCTIDEIQIHNTIPKHSGW